MALLLRNGAVFLHIPKTGGSWVRAVCQKQGLAIGQFGHMHANYEHAARYWIQYPDHYASLAVRTMNIRPVRIGDAFVFCLVRHPLSWIESWWNYNNRRGWPRFSQGQSRMRRWHPTAELERYRPLPDAGFDGFLRFVIDETPAFVSRMYAGYAPPHVAFVGKFENIVADVTTALDRAGMRVDRGVLDAIAPVNVSSRRDSAPVWPEDLRRKIVELEAPALDAYGYDEGPP